MLFLLNTMVVRTQFQLELPPGLEPLARLTPAATLQAGGELYDRHPRLEYDRPDIARWYCTLLQAKFPAAGAVLFTAVGGHHAGRVTALPLPELVRFWGLQKDGLDIADEIRADVWGIAPASV